ncbi:MAG: FAD-dependent oxidoreductase [Spirochaetes bacterium]|nr:FAD-dependent oxidoreductase [Spirochaetota bacterium]MBU1081967.1 FAD-dependent oxidoreductase [Spirochaetota bacterium]
MRKTLSMILVAAVASGLALTSCVDESSIPDRVIVVGSGLAGHAAAYSALESGATVLWIEKNAELGGSTAIATGTFSAAGTELQKAKGISDSVELFKEDLNRIGKGKADQELLGLYATKAAEVWEWFVAHGLQPSPQSPLIDPMHSPYSIARTYTPAKNSAAEYCKVLLAEMARYEDRLTVMKSTAATELIAYRGRVVGVKTSGEGGTKDQYGKAVILATGGFGSNFDMIAKRLPKYAQLRSVTMPHASGDGIWMAEKVGAQLVHMDYLVGYFGAIAEEGTKRTGFGSLTSGFAERWKGDVWLSLEGKRFVDEDGFDEDPRETALDAIPEQTAVIVFDQAAIDRNGGKLPIRNFQQWLEKGYGVKKADSMEDLAKAFGLPVDAVMKTVAQVNENAASGRDPQFGKADNYPLSTPPYYGVKSYGTIFMTQGGIKTNARLEAVSTSGAVIPGLYAAGEVQGTAQWGGLGYAGGSGNTPPLVFGFEAGRNAAALTVEK